MENPLDKRTADAFNPPEGPQPDAFAGGGGVEREVKSGPLSISEVSRLAEYIAREKRDKANSKPDSRAFSRDADKYEGIHKVLLNLPRDTEPDAIDIKLQEGIGDEGDSDFEAAQTFLFEQNQNPVTTRKLLYRKDKQAQEAASATSRELSDLAGLFARQKEAQAAITDNNDRSNTLTIDASDFTDVQRELYSAVHENGLLMTNEQIISHLDQLIAEQEAIVHKFYHESDEVNAAQNRLYTLNQALEFVFNAHIENRLSFMNNFKNARRDTDMLVARQVRHNEDLAKTQDRVVIDKTREALRDEVLLNKVMAVGGFAGRFDLPKGYHRGFRGDKVGSMGYGFDTNNKFPDSDNQLIEGTNAERGGENIAMEDLSNMGVNEVLVSAAIQEAMYETRTQTVNIFTGYRQKTFGDLVKDADVRYRNKPCVSLRYQTTPYSGRERRRSEFSMTFVLPESLALALMQSVKNDPTFMHRLVDRVAVGTYGNSIGLDENMWFTGNESTVRPVRPPYDDWAKQNNGNTKIYVSEGLVTNTSVREENIDPAKIYQSK